METWLTSFSRNQLQIVYCLIGRDGPRVLIANGGQVTHLRREWDCNFWFYVFHRLGVVFVSDEHLKQQMERSLFVLKSWRTKLLLMRTSSWTKTRVSSTLSSHFFSAFVYVRAKSRWNFTFIRSVSLRAQFASVDEIHKEEIRREKRR